MMQMKHFNLWTVFSFSTYFLLSGWVNILVTVIEFCLLIEVSVWAYIIYRTSAFNVGQIVVAPRGLFSHV